LLPEWSPNNSTGSIHYGFQTCHSEQSAAFENKKKKSRSTGPPSKPATAQKARAYAVRHKLPYLALEDGFLRSSGHAGAEPPLSLVLDSVGIYYDANRPSRLETLVCETADDPAALAHGETLANTWRFYRVSKYNHQPDIVPNIEAGFALVIDQTAGDASLVHGWADTKSFSIMLEAAMDENPNRPVLVKVHPDVLAGRKRGCIDLNAARRSPRVHVIATPHHPPALLEQASTVYVVTSQFGFEALIWNVPVRTFGMPFFAGWGLTSDEHLPPSRRRDVPLPALVEAALDRYPTYVNPQNGQKITSDQAIKILAPK
jgi:capsular polysaccharide export protein